MCSIRTMYGIGLGRMTSTRTESPPNLVPKRTVAASITKAVTRRQTSNPRIACTRLRNVDAALSRAPNAT